MERISEAFARARRERDNQAGIATKRQPESRDREDPDPQAIGEIAYTVTRTITLAPQLLREQRIVLAEESGAFSDAYKILRVQVLQRLQERNANALAVTSPSNGEGKSLTAINLAISMAMELDNTVLLVDADLRQPRLHSILGLGEGPGLSDHLISSMPMEEILVHPGVGKLVLLPGGKPIVNSAEMLRSRKMASLVREMKMRYPSRYIVFDLPPLLTAADVVAFSPFVDAALLVVEDGVTRREDLVRASQLLRATDLLGCVLNKVQGSAMSMQSNDVGGPHSTVQG